MGVQKGNIPWNKGKTGLQNGWNKIELEDILSGKVKYSNSHKLKIKLFDDGIKEPKCECCGIDSWNGKSISLELDHKDGDSENNSLENLSILCPNCHSQTDTYKSKNKGNGRHSRMRRYYDGKSF